MFDCWWAVGIQRTLPTAEMCVGKSRRPSGAGSFGMKRTRWCCSTFGCDLKGPCKVITGSEFQFCIKKAHNFLKLEDK